MWRMASQCVAPSTPAFSTIYTGMVSKSGQPASLRRARCVRPARRRHPQPACPLIAPLPWMRPERQPLHSPTTAARLRLRRFHRPFKPWSYSPGMNGRPTSPATRRLGRQLIAALRGKHGFHRMRLYVVGMAVLRRVDALQHGRAHLGLGLIPPPNCERNAYTIASMRGRRPCQLGVGASLLAPMQEDPEPNAVLAVAPARPDASAFGRAARSLCAPSGRWSLGLHVVGPSSASALTIPWR